MKLTRHGPILALILATQAASAWATEESYIIDPAHTFPTFEVSHQGFSTQRGRFNQTSGRVLMDQEKKSGNVDITIDANSIDTGVRPLDDVLRGAGFLNVAQYPTLSFHSTDLKFDGDQLATVDGVFTMLGVSRPVTLTVTHYKCGLDPITSKFVCGVDAETTLKRSDYGMTKLLPFVSDDVKLRIQVEGTREQ
ncbi:MAG TPA: YceI family protein [Thiobacillaceae bacterium]|nr:YceI family protein [Thiobacillaceae bacterium]